MWLGVLSWCDASFILRVTSFLSNLPLPSLSKKRKASMSSSKTRLSFADSNSET